MQAHRNNRRVKTKVPGIYYRQTESGRRRYSFTYRDSSGRQHWQTVEGGSRTRRRHRRPLWFARGVERESSPPV